MISVLSLVVSTGNMETEVSLDSIENIVSLRNELGERFDISHDEWAELKEAIDRLFKENGK